MTEPTPVPRRPRWRELKTELDAIGFRPSRRLGQNFLLDENMVQRIAEDAGVGAGDFVLEVGAGCGFLTAHLAARGVRLLAVEIDRRLFEVASGLLEGRGDVRLLRADVLDGKHGLAAEVDELLPDAGPWHLVGNLPYSIASPLFVVLARRSHPPATMTALVQAEVADRVAARPGTRAWGPLGVRLAARYRAERVRTVGPALFWPRPKVDSAVVRLEARPSLPDPATLEALDGVVEVLFGQRRKAALGLVARRLGSREAAAALFERLGIDPAARAESLGLGALLGLAASPEWAPREAP